jgi:hypothetical protein
MGNIRFHSSMGQETVSYLTNFTIGIILAGLMTHYWARQGRSQAMQYWMISAWVMTLADVLFAIRPELPYWLSRLAPTLLVTVGHAGLFLSAKVTSRKPQQRSFVIVLFAMHAAALVAILLNEEWSGWRMICNGVVWATFSFASCLALRRAPVMYWRPIVSPANVFLLHGLFHLVRMGFALGYALNGHDAAPVALQVLGDLEVSFFMVALFVGILVSTLQLRHEELTHAHVEMHTLAGLLPICAWCKKVRDDDGYWRQVEDYFAKKSQIQFTHGICLDCLQTEKESLPK